MSTSTLHRVRTRDDWSLALEEWPQQGPLRGALLLGHAMMVDRRSFKHRMAQLCARGWRCFALDVRGHGDSGPSAREGGSWCYDDIARLDLPAALVRVRTLAPGVPAVLVGHSLCGHAGIAGAAAGFFARPPDAWVLVAANAWLPRFEPSFRRRVAKRLALSAFTRLSEARGRFPARRLRMGPCDEAAPYVRDIARPWSENAWTSASGFDYGAAMRRVKEPALHLLGVGDRLMAHPVGAHGWAAALPSVEQWIAGTALDEELAGLGARHWELPFDPDHMGLVTDPRSAPLWEAALDWLEERL